MTLQEQITEMLVTTRYRDMAALQVAQYFEKLETNDKIETTIALLNNDNSVAKTKIMAYMRTELQPEIDGYFTNGTIPVSIVQELLAQ